MKKKVLFITDKRFVDYEIPGGVQICTVEFIEYIKQAGFLLDVFKAKPVVTTAKKIKLKLGIEAYDLFNIDGQIEDIINAINSQSIKIVLFNQLNLAYNVIKIKDKVASDVKFIGLSHGNESGDYLHEVTQTPKTSLLNTWRLGKFIVKEKFLFSRLLNGLIVISTHELYVNQWLGSESILYLPRILKPDFIDWSPKTKTIGFVGTLNHLPNSVGVDLLAQQLQLKGFDGKFKLVGGPEHAGIALEKKYNFIEYRGMLDNSELLAEVGSWSIFINPVFWYARGSSTKLSQALNWGIPVLSTPAGARGYDLFSTAILCTDNRPETLADSILNALNSPETLSGLKSSSEENSAHFNTGIWAQQLSNYLTAL